ncbi:MAG TPA: EMC3/TMCO1 family protein [Candidatus Thermoplasmatota archaeon]
MASARKQAPPRPKGQGTMMIFFFVMILIMVDPAIRDGLGVGMSFLLSPTIGFGGSLPVISVMLAGTITGLVSTGLRVWATDFIEVERSRLLQRSFTRQMNDARIRRDSDKLNQLKRAQPHVMSKSMEAQMATMKPAIGTMFLAIAVFWWLQLFISSEVAFKCVSLPWAACWPLEASFGLPYWIAMYSVMSLPFTLAFSAGLKLWRLRNFDPESLRDKPVPSVEEIVERVADEAEDEAVVEQAARRAKRRLEGGTRAAAGEEEIDEEIDDEGDVRIVDDEDAHIVDSEAKQPRVVEEE